MLVLRLEDLDAVDRDLQADGSPGSHDIPHRSDIHIERRTTPIAYEIRDLVAQEARYLDGSMDNVLTPLEILIVVRDRSDLDVLRADTRGDLLARCDVARTLGTDLACQGRI